jgi:hypothetical protein
MIILDSAGMEIFMPRRADEAAMMDGGVIPEFS